MFQYGCLFLWRILPFSITNQTVNCASLEANFSWLYYELCIYSVVEACTHLQSNMIIYMWSIVVCSYIFKKPNYIRKHLNPQQVAKSHAVQKKTPAGDGKSDDLPTFNRKAAPDSYCNWPHGGHCLKSVILFTYFFLLCDLSFFYSIFFLLHWNMQILQFGL